MKIRAGKVEQLYHALIDPFHSIRKRVVVHQLAIASMRAARTLSVDTARPIIPAYLIDLEYLISIGILRLLHL